MGDGPPARINKGETGIVCVCGVGRRKSGGEVEGRRGDEGLWEL